MRALAEDVLPARAEVGPGSVLSTAAGRCYRLGPRLGAGGEGSIFETDAPGLVAKVYLPDRLTRWRFEKLQAMVSKGLDWSDPASEGICWPKDLLRDSDGHFRGYVMRRAAGKSLGRCVFIGNGILQAFPRWDRIDLVTLAITILRKIALLHRAGVLLGDLNPENVLVESRTKVWFVDVDSYQAEGFPCPVGTPHFTPPELQGTDFSKQLRQPEHEHFAVAVLLFMVLMAGKPPFAHQGGGSPTENVRRAEFPYPCGQQSRRTAPAGPWRYIWSNLPFALKQAFFETFDWSCRGSPRRNVEDWLRLLNGYAQALELGRVSRELFPAGLKAVSQHAREKYGTAADRNGIALTCVGCGSAFLFSSREQEFYQVKGLSRPKRCKTCRAQGRNGSVRAFAAADESIPAPAVPSRAHGMLTVSLSGSVGGPTRKLNQRPKQPQSSPGRTAGWIAVWLKKTFVGP